MTITGSGFTGATGVSFGATAGGFTVYSDTVIVATAPTQGTGLVDINVTTPSGSSAVVSADHFTYTAAPVPVVKGITPTTGTIAGGTVVTISGINFTGATAVSFGATAASSFTVASDTLITAVAPANAAGQVDITIVTSGGTSATSAADKCTFASTSAPAVTALSTSTGTTAGGTVLTITGTNFSGATLVSFGTTNAQSFTVNSDTTITVTSPPKVAGTYDITVTTANGTSATGSADQFTYTATAVPTVTGLSSTTANTSGGLILRITGTGFTSATAVTFGTVPATVFMVNSDSLITAGVPPQAAGTVDVTVTTNNGTSATSSADRLTYVASPVPTVTAIVPAAGPLAGGTIVTITGTHFLGTNGVSFGTTPGSNITIYSDTMILITAPAKVAGTFDITATTFSGTSATSSADQFTYVVAPTVTGLNPTSGPTMGTNPVTITGTNFTNATSVYFGTTPATGFTVNSATQITATSPYHVQGTVDVTVTTAGGTSALSSADRYTYFLGGSPPHPVPATPAGQSGNSAAPALARLGATPQEAIPHLLAAGLQSMVPPEMIFLSSRRLTQADAATRPDDVAAPWSGEEPSSAQGSLGIGDSSMPLPMGEWTTQDLRALSERGPEDLTARDSYFVDLAKSGWLWKGSF